MFSDALFKISTLLDHPNQVISRGGRDLHPGPYLGLVGLGVDADELQTRLLQEGEQEIRPDGFQVEDDRGGSFYLARFVGEIQGMFPDF